MQNTDPRLQLTDDEIRQAIANIVRQPVEDVAHYIVLVQTQDNLTIWRAPVPVSDGPPDPRTGAAWAVYELISYINSLMSIALNITDSVD